MGDFIKDLNIIDFLGMLLPGAFVALCLSIQHPGAWQILETAIGSRLEISIFIWERCACLPISTSRPSSRRMEPCPMAG